MLSVNRRSSITFGCLRTTRWRGEFVRGLPNRDVCGFEQMHYDFSVVVHPANDEIMFTFNANVLARERPPNGKAFSLLSSVSLMSRRVFAT